MNNYWHPDNDNEPQASKMPTWFIVFLVLIAGAYTIYACFALGVHNANASKMMQAHLDAMKHPLRDSQPSDFYGVWDKISDEHSDTTKGTK